MSVLLTRERSEDLVDIYVLSPGQRYVGRSRFAASLATRAGQYVMPLPYNGRDELWGFGHVTTNWTTVMAGFRFRPPMPLADVSAVEVLVDGVKHRFEVPEVSR